MDKQEKLETHLQSWKSNVEALMVPAKYFAKYDNLFSKDFRVESTETKKVQVLFKNGMMYTAKEEDLWEK